MAERSHTTPCARPGAAAKRTYPTSEVRGSGQSAGCDGTGMAERRNPTSEAGRAARRSHPAPEARNSGQEEKPHVQGRCLHGRRRA